MDCSCVTEVHFQVAQIGFMPQLFTPEPAGKKHARCDFGDQHFDLPRPSKNLAGDWQRPPIPTLQLCFEIESPTNCINWQKVSWRVAPLLRSAQHVCLPGEGGPQESNWIAMSEASLDKTSNLVSKYIRIQLPSPWKNERNTRSNLLASSVRFVPLKSKCEHVVCVLAKGFPINRLGQADDIQVIFFWTAFVCLGIRRPGWRA